MHIIIHSEDEEQQLQKLLTLLHEFLPPDRVTISQNGELLHPAAPQPNAVITGNCFFMKDKDRYIKVAIADILWVEGSGSAIKIVTETGGEFMATLKMKSFMEQVTHLSLLRIHKSYVVNKCKLTAFDSGVVYINYKGEEKMITIGATYREEFKRQMPRLLSD